MRRIVVGIDGTEPDGLALDAAAVEARCRGAALQVVSVWSFPPMSPEERRTTTAQQLEEQTSAIASSTLERVLGPEAERDLEVGLTIVAGSPAKQILTAADGAELLVVGRRDSSRLRHLLLGSVADQCVRHSPCPVMVVPRSDDVDPTPNGPIVVGLDGSDDSLRGLDWAVEEAQRRDLDVVVVHCWMEPELALADIGAVTPDVWQLEEAAAAQLDGWIAAADALDTSTISGTLRWGDPADVLVEEAEGSSMVVVGSRGRGGFTGLLLGSVSRDVVSHSTVPVVVIPRSRED